MRTLKAPITVRGYDMYDQFQIRGLLAFDPEIRSMRVTCSYGYKGKDGSFIPSEFKDHSMIVTIEGADFDRMNARIRKDDQGTLWDILQERIYVYIQETKKLFRD